MPGLSYSLDKLFFHNLDNLEPSKHSVKDLKGPVGHIVHHEKSLLAVEQHKVLVPPHYSRYVAWGFADHSIRVGPYEMERALFVWEDTPAGEILCCAAPNDKIIITAGTNSMVTVWQYDKKKLIIKKNLYGHTEPVTCLAASRAYNLIVSGSRDRTCILWDLSRLQFVRQLLGHPAPVAAVAINEVTGDIATCAGTHLYLWSINGDEIASVNTATGRADRTQQILCVAFSYLNEWDNQNVIMTGSSDGVVRMWSADYVQIPENTCLSTEEKESETQPDQSQASSTLAPVENPVENKAAEIVRRMSLAGSKDIGELMQRSTLVATEHESRFTKSASGSSLSEEDREVDEEEDEEKETKEEEEEDKVQSPVNNKDFSKDSLIPTQIQHSKTVVGFHSSDISTKNSSNKGKSKKLVHSDHFECPDEPPSNFQRCSTVGPEVTVQSEESESSSSKMRLSKSDTSLTDSFVMITENDALEGERMLDGSVLRSKKKKKILKDGFKWHCQLVFRSKLTMHTAFDRSDNTEPAAVTALAVSRDHKTVYVGDARGRVFSWSVTDKPGRGIADHWVRDEGGENCTACGVKFSFAERRHHCRNCGQLFCSRCSRFESEISRLRILKPVRVCQGCYNLLKPQQETGSSAS